MCASFDTIWIWAIGRPGSSWPGVQCSSRVSCSVTGMRKDTRYDVQYAKRHGVSIERMEAGQADIATFYRLLQETSQRQEFGIHTSRYYDDFMRLFGDQAVLLLARAGGDVTAGLIAARCGAEGRSMYAGSSSHHRVRGDAALLRFEAMRWTRAYGGDRYDLGGLSRSRGHQEAMSAVIRVASAGRTWTALPSSSSASAGRSSPIRQRWSAAIIRRCPGWFGGSILASGRAGLAHNVRHYRNPAALCSLMRDR